jgi:hypothetical protein
VGGHPLRSPTRRRLGRPLPCQLADGPQAPPKAAPFRVPLEHGFKTRAPHAVLAVLSDCYSPLPGRSPTCYAPIRHSATPCGAAAFDLHVLSTPPAFILSQDQTLRMNCSDVLTRKSPHPEIVRCEPAGLRPLALIGQPTHRPTVQAALTTGVASYHSAVVKVRRATPESRVRRQSRRTLPHPPTPRQERRKTDAKSLPSHRPGRGRSMLLFGFAHNP